VSLPELSRQTFTKFLGKVDISIFSSGIQNRLTEVVHTPITALVQLLLHIQIKIA
jgi:hypothetical protein